MHSSCKVTCQGGATIECVDMCSSLAQKTVLCRFKKQMLTYFEVDDPVEEPGCHDGSPDQVDDGVNERQGDLITAQLYPARVQRYQGALKT